MEEGAVPGVREARERPSIPVLLTAPAPSPVAAVRKTVLSVALILTAAPLAAQERIGVRAGVGWARTDYSHLAFVPCFPETDCHGIPSDRILTPVMSVDVGYPTPVEELSFRLSVSYGMKGGTGTGHYADGKPSSGTLRLHFVQFSPLLSVNVRAPQDRFAVSLLAGPWAALRVGCSLAGELDTSCSSSEHGDAGVALGAGVEYRVTNRLTLAAEWIHHWGLLWQNVDGLTRLMAVQAGVAIR